MSTPAPKAASDAGSADPFGPAKANLRDTIKWLTTTFAAISGVVLAGSTLSGLGALPFGWRLGVAVVGALIGFLCTLLAIARVLRLLKSEAFFLGEIERDTQLRTWVDSHAEDLLPPEYSTVQAFLDARRAARLAVAQLPAGMTREQAVEQYKAFDKISARLTSFLHFERMARRLSAESRPLFALAAFGLLGLGVFAWAASPPKPDALAKADKSSQGQQCCCCCGQCAPEARTEKTSIGPEYLGGFGRIRVGRAEMHEAAFETPQDFKAAEAMLDKACAAWRERLAKGYDGLFLAIGTTDRLPLRAASRTRYDANTGLAQARAAMAARRLLDTCKSADDAKLKPEQIIQIVSGPRSTPDSASGKTETGFPEDRRVDMWAIWSPKAK